ncbi:fibronectin type III domain-containing protein, partial [Vicingaceae bacterium]|nr:fibronectin type III domain-containing protein [Vicingaceae bacterium]
NTVGILVDFDGDSRPIAGSTTVDIGADEFTPPSYCNPSPSSVDGSGIVNVTFGGINNTTGSEVGNYGNYSSLIGSVYQGGVASVDITYATGYTYGTKIWVDWNKDADFLDAGEEVYYGLSTNSIPTTLNASFTAPLAGTLGQYRMRIGGSDGNSGPTPCYTGSYASFEDYTLNLTSPPSCLPPSANLATAISADTANVSWIENGSATVYRVEWDTNGYAAGTARNMATVSNDTNYTISGLTAQTSYSWAVKAICSSTDSSTLSGNSFNTKIQGALGVNCSVGNPSTIFSEEFNNNTAGWTGNIGSSGGNWEIPNNATSSNTGADNAHSGSSYMNFEASGGTGGSIVSPAIDLTAAQNDAELSFWMHAYGSNMGDLTVGIGTSATGTFTTVFASSGQIQTAGSDPWINVGIDLASYVGQTIYVEFSMSNYSGFRSDMSIDLFEVSACPLLTPIALPITWDASTVDYSTIDFGGNASAVVADPTNATNTVLQMIKGAGAQTWAGTSFGDSLITAIPFATGTTTIRAVVWSAASGTPVLLKVEDQTNSAISSEILANTVTAGGWDTLSFNLSAGTPAVNFTNTYNKMSMFFNFGVSPASAETYYVDYVDLIANVSPPPPAKAAIALPITWDDTANVNYNTIDFGGNNSSLAADPSNASNLVLQAIKGAGAQTWAGTTFGDSLASAIPFSAGNTTIRAVVYSPAAGLEVRLKVEDKTNSGISVESNVLTSVANGWDTLNFDMSAQSAGTAAINFANTYDKMSMFFNFGVSPASAETYYVDYVDFANPPPPVSSCPPGAVCATFASGDISTTDGAGYPTGSACPGTLTVNIPAGNRIDSVSTVYDMTAQNGAWMSEQTSWLSSSTTLGLEPASSAGTGNTAGTVSYSRNGLTFANGATGAVSLELNARRSWSSGTNPGCSTFNNKVDSSSWSVIAYFSPVPSCVEPLSLSASTINTTTVSVNWTDGNNPAATGGYEISYGLPSFVAGAGTQKIVNSTIDTITGLAASTTYDYYVRAICSSTSSSGWSLVGSFATAAGIPYAQSFETFPATSNSVGSSGWFNINGTTRPTWMSDAGGTGSTGTGPDFDHTLGNASGIYLFLETSGGSLGDRDTLTSPAISVGATQTSLTYTYWYHMAGASMGEMQVWVESNNVWDSLTTFSGAQQPATGSAWLLSSHVLTSYAGQDITLKFIGERGASFTGDMAIDDISVIETPNCLPPSALSSANPTLTSIDLDWVENNSATTWVIEYGPAGFIPGTGTNVTVTAKPFTLTGLTASTTYDFVVRADCSPGLSPNSFSSSFNTSNGVPYFVDFETFSSTSSQGWSQVAAGNPQWLLTSGGTPSSGTGPVVDHTTGTNTGKYVFLETSAGVAGDSDTLISAPIILNANQPLLEFSFWYHFHGASIGSMEAWIIDSSGTLNLLGTIVGQKQAVQTDPWLKAKYIAAGYQGQAVRFAFVGIRGTSFTGDISIDDVRLDLAPPAEIGITNIVRPSSGCGLGADSVEIEITNFGSSSQTSFNVGYSLNGVAIAPETVTATLGVGMTMNYTFTATASIGAAGNYDIITYSMLTGDADSSNDTLGTSLTSFANVAVFPYATSFETGNDSWFATGNASWELGTPAGFIIDTASNGTQAWVTDLDAAYGDGLNAFLTSPCFDFSNVANPAINLDIWYDIESRWDGAFMQATTDGGATWTTIGAEDDFLNWYNDTSRSAVDNNYSAFGDSWTGDGSISGVNGSNGWIKAYHELDGLGGQASVQLRFVMSSDGNTNGDGMGVDNIEIYDRDPSYVIGILNTEDATGVADSLGVVAWTSGVVVGIDLDGNNGISFTIIDDDAAVTQEGMNIFNFNDVSNYVVTEGDEILVHGNILQYNGLTELSPDSIYVLSSGNPIPTPIVVTNLDETTESRWLSIPTSWVSLSTSGAFSSNINLTNGTDTITMRIDSDTDINDSLTSSGMPIIPGDTICGLLGVGGQFDNSSPYTSGYQIFPMRWSDLSICRLATGIENADLVSSEIVLVPNPTNGTFEIRSNGFNNSTINISIRDLNGRIVASEFVNNASGNFRKSYDLNGQAKGIYFITILDGENVTNKKLILQ